MPQQAIPSRSHVVSGRRRVLTSHETQSGAATSAASQRPVWRSYDSGPTKRRLLPCLFRSVPSCLVNQPTRISNGFRISGQRGVYPTRMHVGYGVRGFVQPLSFPGTADPQRLQPISRGPAHHGMRLAEHEAVATRDPERSGQAFIPPRDLLIRSRLPRRSSNPINWQPRTCTIPRFGDWRPAPRRPSLTDDIPLGDPETVRIPPPYGVCSDHPAVLGKPLSSQGYPAYCSCRRPTILGVSACLAPRSHLAPPKKTDAAVFSSVLRRRDILVCSEWLRRRGSLARPTTPSKEVFSLCSE